MYSRLAVSPTARPISQARVLDVLLLGAIIWGLSLLLPAHTSLPVVGQEGTRTSMDCDQSVVVDHKREEAVGIKLSFEKE